MAQPTPTLAPRRREIRSTSLLWLLCAAALVLAVAAVLSFSFLHRTAAPVHVQSAATPAAPVAPIAAAVRPAGPVPAVTTQTPPAATEFSLPSAPPAAGGGSPWPMVVSASPRSPLVVGPGSVPAAAPVPTASPAPLVTAQPAAVRDVPASIPAIPATPLAALSAELRREWPALNIGGSVWSDQPASRFVMVNGQVVREGEAMAPGLVLERIAPKAVQLRWRGVLVEVPL